MISDPKGHSRHTYPIFVSSLCKRAPRLDELRERIYFDIGHEKTVYVDEKVKHRDVSQQDDLSAADELIVRVREARTFVCILAGSSHGSKIGVNGIPARASFFEIELFQAALLGKDVRVLVRDDFNPDPNLEEILRILKGSFSEWRNTKLRTDAQIFAEVDKIADRALSSSPSFKKLVRRPAINRLVQAFFTARSKGNSGRSIRFLNNETDASLSRPRIDLISSIRDLINEQHNEEKRLSRLWIGLRELMNQDPRQLNDPELLESWNALLAEWAKAGAWYGLHADTPLGCLAALNTLTDVRARLMATPASNGFSQDHEFPGGSLASAKYSIAKRLYVSEDRISRFEDALGDLQRSLNAKPKDISGLLAVRGSILRQLGRVSDAIADYEKVVQIRKRSLAADHALGDALSELGYAHLLHLSPRKALRLCEEGVERLREGGRAGFLARGLRKLALAYLANGRAFSAHAARSEARTVSASHGAFDQFH